MAIIGNIPYFQTSYENIICRLTFFWLSPLLLLVFVFIDLFDAAVWTPRAGGVDAPFTDIQVRSVLELDPASNRGLLSNKSFHCIGNMKQTYRLLFLPLYWMSLSHLYLRWNLAHELGTKRRPFCSLKISDPGDPQHNEALRGQVLGDCSSSDLAGATGIKPLGEFRETHGTYFSDASAIKTVCFKLSSPVQVRGPCSDHGCIWNHCSWPLLFWPSCSLSCSQHIFFLTSGSVLWTPVSRFFWPVIYGLPMFGRTTRTSARGQSARVTASGFAFLMEEGNPESRFKRA